MASPLSQFEIKTLIPIELFGYDISFTNSSLAMLVTITSILLFMILGLKNSNIIPSSKQSLLELSYEFIASMILDNVGKSGMKYLSFVFSLFPIILFLIIYELTNNKDFRMVIVEGHTDSDKIPEKLQKIYPSNWELSAARASNVVNYLIDQGVNSGRLQASGYADRWPAEASWYDVRSGKITNKTIKDYNSSDQQKRKNRRIKIVFTNN